MNNKELILNVMYAQGIADALNLRSRAKDMDGTAIIAEESKIPMFDGTKDYSSWAVGSPVYEIVNGEKQVFTLITPYNASYYPTSTPSNTPSLWSIRHTKDPERAKAWLASNGTSGLYMKDEVCVDPNMEDATAVYRSIVDNNAYAPSAYINNWEKVEL